MINEFFFPVHPVKVIKNSWQPIMTARRRPKIMKMATEYSILTLLTSLNILYYSHRRCNPG